MNIPSDILSGIKSGDFKSIARAVTYVENEAEGYQNILLSFEKQHSIPVIGITGPPGAGKSTLINQLLHYFIKRNKRIAVVAVDPSSPFNYGSLLGDRLRLSDFFNNENVFIRSLATRGSLGGLSEKVIEVTDVLQQSNFDYIIVETVGVGQSEIEIAGLADTTVVVFVPESGDDIQTMKSGIMEIADIFVVNKSDREGANTFAANLRHIISDQKKQEWQQPVVQTSALNVEGIEELASQIEKHQSAEAISLEKKILLLTEKAFRLLQRARMKDVSKEKIQNEIRSGYQNQNFNLYQLVRSLS